MLFQSAVWCVSSVLLLMIDLFVHCRSVFFFFFCFYGCRFTLSIKSFMMSHLYDFFTLHCLCISDSQALLFIFVCVFVDILSDVLSLFIILRTTSLLDYWVVRTEVTFYHLVSFRSFVVGVWRHQVIPLFFILCGSAVVSLRSLVSSSKTATSLVSAFHVFTWIHS